MLSTRVRENTEKIVLFTLLLITPEIMNADHNLVCIVVIKIFQECVKITYRYKCFTAIYKFIFLYKMYQSKIFNLGNKNITKMTTR